jgi:hypothetical protein
MFHTFFPVRSQTNLLHKFTSNLFTILGAFAKLRKAAISSVMSVCLSVHIERLVSHWADFHVILHFSIFENLLRKFKFRLNLAGIMGTLHEDVCACIIIFRSLILIIRNISYTLAGKTKTHILRSTTFFPEKSCRLWGKVQEYGTAKQNTDDNIHMAHALCMLDN